MRRLSIFGDSILKGVMFSNDGPKRYCLYRSSLRERLGSFGIAPENHSKMGLTIKDAEVIINDFLSKEKHSEECAGDFALIGFGGNDSMFRWADISGDPCGEHGQVIDLSSFEKTYTGIVEKMLALGIDVTLTTIVPIDPENYVSHVSKKYSHDNIMKWLGTAENLSSMHTRYNDAILSIAKKYNLGLIDLRGVFEGRERSLLSQDGIHPNSAGYAKIENILTSYFAGKCNKNAAPAFDAALSPA